MQLHPRAENERCRRGSVSILVYSQSSKQNM